MQNITLEEIERSQIDCRKRKRKSKGCLEYELYETENNYDLYYELNTGTYEISPSDAFIVTYPCPREVFAGQYRDRVVHHLLINRKNHLFEQIFIDSSYSCRKGKGTLYGINDAYNQLKNSSNNFTREVFIVKGDFVSCFMKVDKNLLLERLDPLLDNDFERDLFKKIVLNRPQDYCIRKSPNELWDKLPKHKSLFYTNGMPIGNLTSQIFVNFYLTPFDSWCTQYRNILGYGRYVDDFFAIFKTIDQAQQFINECQIELAKSKMELHPNKIKILSSKDGFNFIGAYIKPHRIYCAKRSINKLKQTLYEKRNKPIEDWFGSINSYLGHLQKYKCYKILWKILQNSWTWEYGYFKEDLSKFIPFKDYQDIINCKKSKWTKANFLGTQKYHLISTTIKNNIDGSMHYY